MMLQQDSKETCRLLGKTLEKPLSMMGKEEMIDHNETISKKPYIEEIYQDGNLGRNDCARPKFSNREATPYFFLLLLLVVNDK